jgi:hypothetical protein
MVVSARTTYLWGLRRSGNHLLANWLYANHGATAKNPLDTEGLHPQLFDGYCDRDAGVAFYNNCGRVHSRELAIGSLVPDDFERAARAYRATIFGLEDCALEYATRTTHGPDTVNILVLRDPLNNVASRLEALKTRPYGFRVDEPYIDLVDAFCSEYLGHTSRLSSKTVVNYNRFVAERAYRDEIAGALGLRNVDAVSEVSGYGGGSSFSPDASPPPATSLTTRFQQHPIPRPILDLLVARRAIQEVCHTVFGYDLTERAAGA